MYNTEQIVRYFERIEYRGSRDASLENLCMLHRQHLLHIPYENLDIINGVSLSLNPECLFEKIILNKRGGYSFELQGLFCCLLKSLGYQVMQYAGRVMDHLSRIQMRRHRIIVVRIEGARYVCDVGVSQESFRYPLVLQEGIVQTDGFNEYRFIRDDFYGWVLMQKIAGEGWKTILGFTEEPQVDDDFIMPSFYCEKHPDSTFNKYMKISIFTNDTNFAIIENKFFVFNHGKIVEKNTLLDDDEVRSLLEKRFGIDVPESYRTMIYRK